MGVILWNHIFKTVLGYFLLVSKNDKIVSDFKLFTYRWKTFGFELLHSLEHILLDATSWGLGINVGIMPWDSASSAPPLLHLDPLLQPGLNNPAITRAKNQCLPWSPHSRSHKTFVRLHCSKGLITTPRRLSDFYTMSKVLLLTFKGTYSCGWCLLHLQDIPCISPASRAQLESQVCEEEPLETTFHSCGTCSLFLLSVLQPFKLKKQLLPVAFCVLNKLS